jgi:hypothetical protein
MAKNGKRSADRQSPQAIRLPSRGIFLMADVKDSVEWQPAIPANLVLAKRIAFNCFLCDVELTTGVAAENRATDEDVFPEWLQRRFDLSDKYVPLKNGNRCKYSELLIPACQKCNNEYMSRIEERVARALDGDFKRFLQLRKEDLYIWCAKIYYGLIYHETKLCDWRTADASFSPSLPNAILRELSFLLDLLQGFRKRVLVSGPRKLFSLLSFPLHADGDPADTFHPAIQVQFPCIALRLGSVGVLCVLDDFGTTENAYAQIFEPALRGKTLDPIQFWELVGRLSLL